MDTWDSGERYSFVVQTPEKFNKAQLLDQALDKIKKTGIFANSMKSVTTWNARGPNNKNWQNMKAHFIEAYDVHLESGPTANTVGYHGAAAALSNDDSLCSIPNSIAQMNLANNPNIRAMNKSMSTVNAKLRQALFVTQQQVAALARAINQNHQAPALSTSLSVGCIIIANGGQPILCSDGIRAN